MMMSVKVKLIILIHNKNLPSRMENKRNPNKLTKKLKIALLKTNRLANKTIHSNHANLINRFQPMQAIIHKMTALLRDLIPKNDPQQNGNLRLTMASNNLNNMSPLQRTQVILKTTIAFLKEIEANNDPQQNDNLRLTMDRNNLNNMSLLQSTKGSRRHKICLMILI